jgi:hypothetical protein
MIHVAARPIGRGVQLLALAFALVGALPATSQAQAAPAAPSRGWTRVRVAKWALLGAATGFAVYALNHSSRAEHDYGRLRALCDTDPDGCSLDAGRYAADEAEALYQSSLREDQRAQRAIIGGQVVLLGSVALFVYDLRNARGPQNIPYPSAGLARAATPRGVAVGARLRF